MTPRASGSRTGERGLRDRRDRGRKPLSLLRARARRAVHRGVGEARLRDMYADIDTSSQRALTPSEFAGAYEGASRIATITGMHVTGKSREVNDDVEVPVRVQTRLFGTLSSDFTLPLRGSGAGTRIAWSRSLAFPGLRIGERLSRHMTLPRRATLLARDGSVLAEGAALEAGQRNSPLGSVASAVLGTIGPIPAARLRVLEAEGVPANAIVGVSGLELAFDSSLRGSPGGELLAVNAQTGEAARVLASATPKAASAVHTTISPSVQRAAVTALGGQLGGIVALSPSTGQILAVAGIGLDDLQPPGSTFKMITLTRRPAGRDRQPAQRLPLRDLRDARRSEAEQRKRRGMRRLARTRVRGLVQLRVRAARGQARRGTPGGDGGTLWLQPSPRSAGRGRKHAAARRPDPGRTRHRLDRDRPGRGAGQRAGDGHGRRDDRRRRSAPSANIQPSRSVRHTAGAP